MKIVYLNLFEGCLELGHYERLLDYIKKECPDVVGFSEMNSWEKNELAKVQDFSQEAGFPFFQFCQTQSGYHLGLFSKLKLTNIFCDTKGFRHGVISAEVATTAGPLRILLTHLSPETEDNRLKEAQLVIARLVEEKLSLAMGDFNSLSPQDPYQEDVLLAKLQAIKLTKFGTQKLRTEVIKKFLSADLVDAVKVSNPNFESSVPTLYNKAPEHFAPIRLDYIFITPELKAYLQSAQVVKNPTTENLSDHFPVIATFNF